MQRNYMAERQSEGAQRRGHEVHSVRDGKTSEKGDMEVESLEDERELPGQHPSFPGLLIFLFRIRPAHTAV